jgi:hypothetical protein
MNFSIENASGEGVSLAATFVICSRFGSDQQEARPTVQAAGLDLPAVSQAYAAGSQTSTRFYGLGGKGRDGGPIAGVKY